MIIVKVFGGNITPDLLRAELEAALGGPVTLDVIESDHVSTYTLGADESTVRAVVGAHRNEESQQFDRLVVKARQVWAGQGSFTNAQRDKILAGLVLLEARRR